MSTLRVNELQPASGSTITIGGAGITVDLSSSTTTLPTNVVTTDGTQTLTNKTIGVSQLDGTIGVSQGGTGLTALGSANQYLKVNSAGNALEYGTVDLTNLDASNLTSGTVDIARLPTITVAKGGTGLTSLGTAGQVLSVNSGATALEYSTIDLTNLNADNLTSGTVSLSRLPTITTAKGGTGLTSIGSSGQVLRVATNGVDLEYHTLASIEGGAIAAFTIADDTSTVINVADGSELQIAGGGSVTSTAVEGNVLTITVDDDLSNFDNSTSGFITGSSSTTLTNKTFDANGTGNSISNIEVADLASGVLDIDLDSVSASDDTLASAKAIKSYVDNSVAFSIMDDSSTTEDVPLGNMISILGGTNINTSVSGSEVTINLDTNISVGQLVIDSGLLTLDGTAITGSGQINLSTNGGSNDGAVVINNDYVLPVDSDGVSQYDFLVMDNVSTKQTAFRDASTVGLVTATSINTFQNKTFNLGVGYTNSMDFNRTAINTALSDDTFVFVSQGQTLNNKTLSISGANSNTISGLTASKVAVSSSGGNLTAGGDIPTGDFVGTSDTQTLTNKTIDYNSNTITNLPNSDVTLIAEDSSSITGNTLHVVGEDSFGVDTRIENGKLKIGLNSSRIEGGGVIIATGTISTSSGNIGINPGGSGAIILDGYYVLPTSSQDGSAGHALLTDGSGNLDFASPIPAFTAKSSGGSLSKQTSYLSVRTANHYYSFPLSGNTQGDWVVVKDGTRNTNTYFMAFSGRINGTNYTGGASDYIFFNEQADEGAHLHFVYVDSTIGWALTRLDGSI